MARDANSGHRLKMRNSLPSFPFAMMPALKRMNLHEEQFGSSDGLWCSANASHMKKLPLDTKC